MLLFFKDQASTGGISSTSVASTITNDTPYFCPLKVVSKSDSNSASFALQKEAILQELEAFAERMDLKLKKLKQ